jgi:hypothetical protein
MTPLDEGSAVAQTCTSHATFSKTGIHVPVGMEPKIPTTELPQTQTLDPVATKRGCLITWRPNYENIRGIYFTTLFEVADSNV